MSAFETLPAHRQRVDREQAASIAADISESVEVLAEYRRLNPGLRLARYKTGGALGVWNAELGRFQAFLGKLIGKGEWCQLRVELLVNGKTVWEADAWVE